MADFDTPTACKLLKTWSNDPAVIDHWVATHQILPFFATIYGWEFRWVIIATYLLETIENFVWCLEGAYTEDFSNTSISDPLHGVLGALLGYLFRRAYGVLRDESIFIASKRQTIITIFDTGILVAPSAIFYRDSRNLDWLYLLFFPIAFFIVSRHVESMKMQKFVVAYAYVCVTCFVVFAHPLKINSFYAAWITAVVFAILFSQI